MKIFMEYEEWKKEIHSLPALIRYVPKEHLTDELWAIAILGDSKLINRMEIEDGRGTESSEK